MLLHHYNTTIEIRKLALVCYDHLILRSLLHSGLTHCISNVLYGKVVQAESRVVFRLDDSCLVCFNLEQVFIFFLTSTTLALLNIIGKFCTKSSF